MNPIVWLVTGAAIAWLACLPRVTMCRQRLFIEAAFAAAGALLGGWCGEALAGGQAGDSGWPGLAGAVVGAGVLLAIANLRARRMRHLR